MRAPFRSMLPLSRGVSMVTRGEAATTASRVRDCGCGVAPATARHRRSPVCGASASSDFAGARLQLRLLLLFELGLAALLFHLRIADEILPADHDNERQHDGKDGVLVLDHSALLRRGDGRTLAAFCGAAFATGRANLLHVGGRARRYQFPCSAEALIRASAESSSCNNSPNGAASAARRPIST